MGKHFNRKEKQKICKTCGADFLGVGKQIYCSPECRKVGFDKSIKASYEKLKKSPKKDYKCNVCELTKKGNQFNLTSRTNICKECYKEIYKYNYESESLIDFYKRVTEFLLELKWRKRFYMDMSDVFKSIDIYYNISRKETEDVYYMIQRIIDWWVKRKEKNKILIQEIERKWIIKKQKYSNETSTDLIKCKCCGIKKIKSTEFRHIIRKNKLTGEDYIQILGYCKSCERDKRKKNYYDNKKRKD